ncbi:MAG TPA: acyl-CoA dehydrogenase family protein, partial [Acidimicrobiales bacterium]|nr:acyl-CoA dehydrogenase family protein [Acidimicrobiales bacterium]
MDFELSDDERLLAEGIRRLCSGRFSLDHLRAGEGRSALDEQDWAVLADFGVFSLTRPEPDGGLGLGMAHAAVVYEELGRALVPGPIVATHVAAPYVDGAATGKVAVGLVRAAPSEPGTPRTPGTPGTLALPILVDDVASLGALLVVTGDEVRRIEPGELAARPIERPVDPLTPLWRVDPLPAGTVVAGADPAALWRDYLVLSAALLVGM